MVEHSINHQWYVFLVKNPQLGMSWKAFLLAECTNEPLNSTCIAHQAIAFKHTPHLHTLTTNPPQPLKYPIS